MERRKRILQALAVLVAGGLFYWVFFGYPADPNYQTYEGPHGEIFMRFDTQGRLIEFGTVSGSAKAKLEHPNGARTLCAGRHCGDPKGTYWTAIYYVDKDGMKLWKTNDNPKTDHFPSPSP